MEPLDLIGAGGASGVLLAIIVYLLRQLDAKRSQPDPTSDCAKQIEQLSRIITQQQELQGQTLETMKDLISEVRSAVNSIQSTLSQRIAIEEDRLRREGK